MEVLDIVQSAAFKAGIVPSFNPDEFPDDVYQAGKKVLTDEILPTINCDRTLDVTVTARTYTPQNGRIVLTPYDNSIENLDIIGYSQYTANELLTGIEPSGITKWGRAVQLLRPDWVVETASSITRRDSVWPVNAVGQFRRVAIWSSDLKFIYGDAAYLPQIYNQPTIDFTPMRVDSVIEYGSKLEYDYLYRREFEQVLDGQFVFTTEEHDNSIIVLIHGSMAPKKLVMPVPRQIIDIRNDHAGTINAPAKFKRFLIDATAVSLALIYGVNTADAMQAQANTAYELLKKNHPQPLHKPNVSDAISNTLYRRRLINGHF